MRFRRFRRMRYFSVTLSALVFLSVARPMPGGENCARAINVESRKQSLFDELFLERSIGARLNWNTSFPKLEPVVEQLREQDVLAAATFSAVAADEPNDDADRWRIKDIYNYLNAAGEDLSDEEIQKYCRFIIDCQDARRGTFADKFHEYIYSVKAYHLLNRFGYEPKYRLAVIQQVGKDLHYGRLSDDSDVIVTDTIDPKLFRQWLDRIRATYNAYEVGSLAGHFIHPHAMNLEEEGESLEDSPYIKIFREWILENQGENGFWNRPDDTDFNGWNGAMKMDSALKFAGFSELPNADRMIKTILKYQNPKEGSFTAAGGCTNTNALHTLRQCSKRSNLTMWADVFLTMERHMDYLERRWDPDSGLFRTPPGFDGPLNEFATSVAASEAGNVIDYCMILLRPENAQRIASEASRKIGRDRIRKLLVQATGLAAVSASKTKALAKAKHADRYGEKAE